MLVLKIVGFIVFLIGYGILVVKVFIPLMGDENEKADMEDIRQRLHVVDRDGFGYLEEHSLDAVAKMEVGYRLTLLGEAGSHDAQRFRVVDGVELAAPKLNKEMLMP